jgi:hypothetical protein
MSRVGRSARLTGRAEDLVLAQAVLLHQLDHQQLSTTCAVNTLPALMDNGGHPYLCHVVVHTHPRLDLLAEEVGRVRLEHLIAAS